MDFFYKLPSQSSVMFRWPHPYNLPNMASKTLTEQGQYHWTWRCEWDPEPTERNIGNCTLRKCMQLYPIEVCFLDKGQRWNQFSYPNWQSVDYCCETVNAFLYLWVFVIFLLLYTFSPFLLKTTVIFIISLFLSI